MNETIPQDCEPPSGSDLSAIEVVLETSPEGGELFAKTELPLSDFKTIGESASLFRQIYFPFATDKQWNSWRWQIQNSYSGFKRLSEVLDLSQLEDFDFLTKSRKLPLRITPYYASLLFDKPADYALKKTVIPSRQELILSRNCLRECQKC